MNKNLHDGRVLVRDGALQGLNLEGGGSWRWSPPGARVIGILAIPEVTDVLVLAEPIEALPKGAGSLFRCRVDGNLVWTAEVPSGGDGTYVSATVMECGIVANTWDGRRVVVDLGSGRIRAVTFAK